MGELSYTPETIDLIDLMTGLSIESPKSDSVPNQLRLQK